MPNDNCFVLYSDLGMENTHDTSGRFSATRDQKKGVIAVIHQDQTTMQELTKHLTECVKYPATKQTIVEQCDNMSHIPDAGQRVLKDNLPNRVFTSAEDVLAALPI